jgi:hypothetical protein
MATTANTGTTQPLISFAPPFELPLIKIPEPRQYPKIPIENTEDIPSHKLAKKQKKNHTVRFKVDLCEFLEIPDRITLRNLANAVSPVACATDSQESTNASSITLISVGALNVIIQRARNLD